mgnify:CR=1 FL=1
MTNSNSQRQILILGAGKSCAHLIKYLSEHTLQYSYKLVILDINTSLVPKSIVEMPQVEVYQIESGDISQYENWIKDSYITISMLPAFMHMDIAKQCLRLGSHLITPSYISDEMKAIGTEVESKNLIFLNEMGFDPGIDHMTTLKIYHQLESEGAKLYSYKSYAGGLVAKHCDNNPWHYKFSWNPRNVILAGQGGEIKYKKNDAIERLDYYSLFKNAEKISISNGLEFDAYANRDSLKYESLYGWANISTLLRGTLRHDGFCKAWNTLIELGLTDNSIQLVDVKGKSYSEFYQRFTQKDSSEYLSQIADDSILKKLNSIGFEDNNSLIEKDGTAAEILQSILEKKWKLEPEDTDWIVMVHFLEYEKNGQKFQLESYLSLEGENALYTAMSKTVGMPIAFAAIMVLNGEIKSKGVLMPSSEEIYNPILNQLEKIGVKFQEKIYLMT